MKSPLSYDEIQMYLGGVGDNYSSSVKEALKNPNLNTETRIVLQKICNETENSLNEICSLISNVMQLNG